LAGWWKELLTADSLAFQKGFAKGRFDYVVDLKGFREALSEAGCKRLVLDYPDLEKPFMLPTGK
jgi:hypothetical protein